MINYHFIAKNMFRDYQYLNGLNGNNLMNYLLNILTKIYFLMPLSCASILG